MATAAPLPTPAHQLSDSNTKSSPATDAGSTDVNFQGLPVPRGPVTASLSFYEAPEDGSKPYNYVEKPTDGRPQRNYGDAWHDVPLSDLRGRETHFNLDNNAFEAIANVSSDEHDFTDDARVKRVYYPEVENLLLSRVPGATRVVIFDHTIRRSDPSARRAPVTRVHIDQTPSSAAARVRHHLPDDEADALLRGRYRLINVWRPLNRGPVMAHPLAVADGATVLDEDLVGIEHRYPDRTGETAGVQWNASQRWYYWSGMTGDERLLLKCFDSDESVGQWGRVPHTAFVHPRTPEGAVGRESIEVRALVFG